MRDILIIILLVTVFGLGVILWPLAIVGLVLLIIYIAKVAKPKEKIPSILERKLSKFEEERIDLARKNSQHKKISESEY